MELKGSTVIVTGSSTGIGAATAELVASKGSNVVINFTRSEREAEETAAACEALGVEALLCRADVSSDEDCKRMARAAMDKWDRVDGLVNNAGITKFVALDDLEGLSAEDFQHIFAVNVVGAYQMARAAAPYLKAGGGGSIVNVSSIAGLMGLGSSIAYAASKGALNTLTLSLARVLGPEVRVNAVCPGFVQTRWLKEGLGADYDAFKGGYEAQAPLKESARPEDIARGVVFFLEAADHVTGERLTMDGGWHLGGALSVTR